MKRLLSLGLILTLMSVKASATTVPSWVWSVYAWAVAEDYKVAQEERAHHHKSTTDWRAHYATGGKY